MRIRAAGTAVLCAITLGTGAAQSLSAAAAAPAGPPPDCKISKGADTVAGVWPQRRLNFTRAWAVTRGRGVVIGVVDSGLNTAPGSQLAGIRTEPGRGFVKGLDPKDTTDCYGHGTAVTSIIAAQPSTRSDFVGVAPDATIIAFKQADSEQLNSGSVGIAEAIDAAVDAGAQVVNVSVTSTAPSPDLEAAVAHARTKDVLIVAAAGNEGQQQNLPAYPAAFSTKYDNVVAVSASSEDDSIAKFAETGSYVTVAAPGVKVPVSDGLTGYTVVDGTSFSTPYVTGTAALVRAAFPKMSAAQVRDRIIVTADAPPRSVPDPKYGYGIINPFLAVTTVGPDTVPVAITRRAEPLPAPSAAPVADRSLQDRALGTAFALLGLAVLAATVALVLRGRRPTAGTRPR